MATYDPQAIATTQQMMNAVNQNSPLGSVNYTQTKDANGNPVLTQNTSLSPGMQSLFDFQMGQSQSLGGGAQNSLVNQINNNAASGYNTSGFSPVSGGMDPSQFQNWGNSLSTSAGPSQYSNSYGASAQGYGAQNASATGYNPSGANYGQIQNQLSNQDLQGAFNQQQQNAYQGQMAYLQPQQQDQTAQAQDQLRQQGITQESNPAAYGHAMDALNRQQTFANQQAYNSSYQSGLQGANQLFNQNLSSGQFNNAAQNQGYTQSLDNANIYNQAGQFNAGAQNTANLQNSNLGTQANAYGAQAQNSANQFNAGAQNTNSMFNATQGNQMNLANSQLNNSAMQQYLAGFGANAGLNNQANAQQYTNMFNMQNQPISQLNSLRGMTQVQSPTAATPPTTDYASLANNAYQSQLASQNNNTAGLYSLGGTALAAGLSNPGAITSIGNGLSSVGNSIGTGLSNLGSGISNLFSLG